MNFYRITRIKKSTAAAAIVLAAACMLGQSAVSEDLKLSRLTTRAQKGDETAREALAESCKQGQPRACINLWGSIDDGEKYEMLAEACQKLHSGEACLILARLNDRKKEGKNIPAVSCTVVLGYLQKECEGGDGKSCTLLGDQYRFHHDPPRPGVEMSTNPRYPPEKDCAEKDYEKAFEYYSIGCRHGADSACGNLAEAYKNGHGTKRNEKKANKIFHDIHERSVNSCNHGNEYACSDVGFDLEDENPAESKKYYQKACDLGLKGDCANGTAAEKP